MKSPEDFHHEHPDVFRRLRSAIGRTEEVSRYLEANGLLSGARSLLSIGPGEGDLEVELAGSLERIGVVDPDARALEILRERLRECGLETRLGVCVADRFQAAMVGIRERFDLVLAIHSWYAIARDRDALERALALRTASGTLVIALASREGMATRLKALGPRALTDPTAEEISAWASLRGHSHSFELRNDPKPAGLYIRDEQLTDVGRALVGFLVSAPWEEMTEELREAGVRIVRAHVRAGEIDLVTGWLVFRSSTRRRPA